MLSQIQKLLRKVNAVQFFAIMGIGALMLSDYIVLVSFFESGDIDLTQEAIDQSYMYCGILAICLEGLPAIMGYALSRATEKAKYNTNEIHIAWVGFIFSFVGTLMTFAVVFFLRGLPVLQKLILLNEQIRLTAGATENTLVNSPFAAYLLGEYDTFPYDAAMTVYPLLTSVFSFAISWMLLGKDSAEQTTKNTHIAFDEYLSAAKDFQLKLGKLQDARSELWSMLSSNQNLPEQFSDEFDEQTNKMINMSIPKRQDVFKKVCYGRIRSKIIEICISAYPDQLQRYNTEVEAKLQQAIGIMKKYSTVPDEIESIDVKSIIEKHDAYCVDSGNPDARWNYSASLTALTKSLRMRLNNNVIVQQVKTSSTAYPREGEPLR